MNESISSLAFDFEGLLSSNKSWSRTNLSHAAEQMGTVGFAAVKALRVGYLHLFQHDISDINLQLAVKSDSGEARDLIDSFLSAASSQYSSASPSQCRDWQKFSETWGIYFHDRFSLDDMTERIISAEIYRRIRKAICTIRSNKKKDSNLNDVSINNN